MFMSTRYKKRPEAFVIKNGKIFSIEDSLAKLCEFLNNESSVTKLITPKFKDFRSQKLKFDQKTRLNNAIWRAWHIQYKQKKKARFLQFAAPFSDETAHSLSHAVILEGNYWKRRLDAVSTEFKKWRRIHKEKLLKSSGPNREEINKELTEEQEEHWTSESENESEENENHKKPSPSCAKQIISEGNQHENYALSAMYDFHDTLFSSLEKTAGHLEAKLNLNHSEFKDFSGMVQPTLDHLNPSFDMLLENFDFYSECYQPQQVPASDSELLLDSSHSYEGDTSVNQNPFMHQDVQQDQQHQQHEKQQQNKVMSDIDKMSDTQEKNVEVLKYRSNNFQELPPQLQAPNLTARIQQAMITRPKPLPRNRSDPCLTQHDRIALGGSKRESSTSVSIASTSKKPRHNASQEKLNVSTGTKHIYQDKSSVIHTEILPANNVQDQQQQEQQLPHNLQFTVTPIHPKSKITASIPILPKYTKAYAPYLGQHIPSKSHPGIILGAEIPVASTEITSSIRTSVPAISPAIPGHSSSPGGMSYVIIAENHSQVPPVHVPLMQSSSKQQIHEPASNTTQHEQQQKPTQRHQQDQQENVIVSPGPHRLVSQHVNQSLEHRDATDQLQQATNALTSLPTQPGVNEQHLITLAQLLQNAPTQGTEQTLNYLELLQQQLSLMLKHQQESLQLKQQIQQQTEKMLHHKQSTKQYSSEKPLQQQALKDFTSSLTHETASSLLNRSHQSPGNAYHGATVSDPTNFSNLRERELSHHSYLEKESRSSECLRKVPSLRHSLDNTMSLSHKMFHSLGSSSTQHLSGKHDHVIGDIHNADQEDEGISFSAKKQTSITVISKAPITPTRIKVQPSVPPTTLDSAIALVALRHGSMSPETSDDLPRKRSPDDKKFADISFQGKSIVMQNDTNTSIDTASGNEVTTVRVTDRNVYNEHRRKCHLSAEQRRRGLIKNAFEDLGNILNENGVCTPTGPGRGSKLSNAAILQQTCEYIKRLQDERMAGEQRLSQIKKEIEDIRSNINECQKRLPTSGNSDVVHQSSDAVERGFFEYCKDMIRYDRKSWLFCTIMKPLFDSYNNTVTTKTVDEFVSSVMTWFQSYCPLPNMRIIILETLTKLSTSTTALDDPTCIATLSESALQLDDPTDISATAAGVKNVTSAGAQSSTNTDSSSPVWNYPSRFGKKNI